MKFRPDSTRLPYLLLGILTLFPALMPYAAASDADLSAMEKVFPRLEIEFDYQRQSGIASNQFAVWIEDVSGKHIATLYATRFTATGGGKKRPACLPDWVAAARPDDLANRDVDAITGATPVGGRFRCVWHGKDHSGKPVPQGTYRFVVEANLRWDNRVIYRGEIELGGSIRTFRPEPEFTGEADQERGMITNVVVRCVP